MGNIRSFYLLGIISVLIIYSCYSKKECSVENLILAVEFNDNRQIINWFSNSIDSLALQSHSLHIQSPYNKNILLDSLIKAKKTNELSIETQLENIGSHIHQNNLELTETYNLLQNINTISNIMTERSLYSMARALDHYGLFIIDHHSLQNQVPFCRTRLLNNIAISHINENPNSKNNESIEILQDCQLEYKRTKHWNLYNKAVIDLLNLGAIDSIKMERLIHTKSSKNNSYTLLKEGIILESSDEKAAINKYNKVMQVLKSNTCHIEYAKAYYYKIDMLIKLNEFEKALDLLENISWFQNCSNIQKDENIHIRNYSLRSLLDSKPSIMTFQNTLDTLLFMRNHLPKVMSEQASFHFDEALSYNTGYILDLFISNRNESVLTSQEIEIILSLISQSKSRELKVKETEKFQNPKIRELILKGNELYHEFENTKFNGKYNNDILPKMLIHEIKKYQTIDQFEKLKNDEISIPKKPTIEIFNSGLMYYIINNLNGDWKINSYSKGVIDSLIPLINESLATNKFNLTTSNQIRFIQDSILKINLFDHKKVTILPDGQFYNLPFSTFPIFSTSQLNYNYNLQNSTKEFVYIDKKQSLLLSYSDSISQSNLEELEYEELPNSIIESTSIQNILGDGEIIAGKKIGQLPSKLSENKYSILHISTHASNSDNSIFDSHLILKDNQAKHSKLYCYELLKHELPKFTYLNTCHSGTGKYYEGEGTYSLSRYFIQGGTKSVIKSLWDIDDRVSSFFSQKLYSSWIEGISLGEAFHLAQQATKAKYPQPYHWAPFVLEGNPNLYLK